MLRGQVMILPIKTLAKQVVSRLCQGLMQEDMRNLWFSKEDLLDFLYNGDLGPFKEGEYDEMPEEFWKKSLDYGTMSLWMLGTMWTRVAK